MIKFLIYIVYDLIFILHITKQNKIQSLRKETDGRTSLIGFIGAPWTLVAYSVEGGHSKLCPNIKKMCLQDPVFAHSILEKYTEALCTYASYQVRTRLSIYFVCLHLLYTSIMSAFASINDYFNFMVILL